MIEKIFPKALGARECMRGLARGYYCTREPHDQGPHVAHEFNGRAVFVAQGDAPVVEYTPDPRPLEHLTFIEQRSVMLNAELAWRA